MELSVIVTHHRELDLLKQCLVALRKNLQEISHEIVVVLSEYQQETLENLKHKFPGIKLLPFKKNLYFVQSANRGLEQAQGNFILIINDDVIITKKSVQLLFDFLENNKEVGLVGPKVLYPDRTNQQSCFRFYTPLTVVCRRTILGKTGFCKKLINRFLYYDKDLNQKNGIEVDWLMNGSGVMTKKEYLGKIGFLDERFKHYFSDVDWSRRFWQKGLKVVYFPEAIFFHHHMKSSVSRGIISVLTNKMTRIHIWDGMKYFWKWGIKK